MRTTRVEATNAGVHGVMKRFNDCHRLGGDFRTSFVFWNVSLHNVLCAYKYSMKDAEVYCLRKKGERFSIAQEAMAIVLQAF